MRKSSTKLNFTRVLVLSNVTECQVLLFLIFLLFIFSNRPNTERWPIPLVGGERIRCMRNFRTGFRYLCCCWDCFVWSSGNGNDSLKLSCWFFHLCLQWRETVCNTWKRALKTVISHFSLQAKSIYLFKVPGCSLVIETMINVGDMLSSESVLPVVGSSSRALVSGLGHVIEKWNQILGQISNKDVPN